MASLQDAFPTSTGPDAQEIDENPQSQDQTPYAQVHKKPARHELGVIAGNEVAGIKGNRVDLESDLLGITRPNSDAMKRHHMPPTSQIIDRKNPKIHIKVDATPKPLETQQMWAYPATIAPLPLVKETCGAPQKY